MPKIGYPKIYRIPKIRKSQILDLPDFGTDELGIDTDNELPIEEFKTAKVYHLFDQDELALIQKMARFFRLHPEFQPELGYADTEHYFIDTDSIFNKIHKTIKSAPMRDKKTSVVYSYTPAMKPLSVKQELVIDKLRKMNKKQRKEFWNQLNAAKLNTSKDEVHE